MEEMVSERDFGGRAMARRRHSCRSLPGIAVTGGRVHWNGIMMHRVQNGRSAEGWSV
jgi:predicted ester cyclase